MNPYKLWLYIIQWVYYKISPDSSDFGGVFHYDVAIEAWRSNIASCPAGAKMKHPETWWWKHTAGRGRMSQEKDLVHGIKMASPVENVKKKKKFNCSKLKHE